MGSCSVVLVFLIEVIGRFKVLVRCIVCDISVRLFGVSLFLCRYKVFFKLIWVLLFSVRFMVVSFMLVLLIVMIC